jgi:hypothetical protein
MEDIKIFETTVDAGMVIYKAVGNEADLTEYNDVITKKCQERYSGAASFDLDWSAMYTQLFKSHALGTVCYRWEGDDPYSHSNLLEITIEESLQVIVCNGSVFHDGNISGSEKAALVKSAIGIPISAGLMDVLGEQRKALLMEETQGEWELIFNRSHLSLIQHKDRMLGSFERSAVRGCTQLWCAYGDEQHDDASGPHMMRYECDEMCVEALGGEAVLPSWLVNQMGPPSV